MVADPRAAIGKVVLADGQRSTGAPVERTRGLEVVHVRVARMAVLVWGRQRTHTLVVARRGHDPVEIVSSRGLARKRMVALLAGSSYYGTSAALFR